MVFENLLVWQSFKVHVCFFVTFDIMVGGMFVQWNLDITNLYIK